MAKLIILSETTKQISEKASDASRIRGFSLSFGCRRSDRRLLNLNSDHFYIFGKAAKAHLDLLNLLGTGFRQATGVVGQLLLVDARDGLKRGERKHATVIIEERGNVEIVNKLVLAIENRWVRLAPHPASLQPKVDALLNVLAESLNGAAVGNNPTGDKVAGATVAVLRARRVHYNLFHISFSFIVYQKGGRRAATLAE